MFGINVGVHQGSVLSPLLFIIVMEAVTHSVKVVGVNSNRCTQCVQWVHTRCSRVEGSLKKVESSFICRRCKGELSETRQVYDLHMKGKVVCVRSMMEIDNVEENVAEGHRQG